MSKKEIVRLKVEKKITFEYNLLNFNLKKLGAIFFLEKKKNLFNIKKQYLINFFKNLKFQKNLILKTIFYKSFSEELLLKFKTFRIFFEYKLKFFIKLINFFYKKNKKIQYSNFFIFKKLKNLLKIKNFSSKHFLKKIFQKIKKYNLKKIEFKKKINFFFQKKNIIFNN